MTTYTIGRNPQGYRLIRWAGGRATVIGSYPTEAAALAALVARGGR